MAEKKPQCPNGHSGHMIPVQKQPHEVPSTPQPGWVCAVCGAIVMRCVYGTAADRTRSASRQPHEVPSTPQPGWVCAVCGAIVMRCVCGRPLYRDPSTRAVEDCRNRDCLLAKKTLPKARKMKPSAPKRPPRR